MRVAVRGPLNVYSGYGNDLVGLTQALVRDGHDVVLVPTSIMSGLPPEVAQLLVKPPTGRFDLGIMHQPPFNLKPPRQMRESCDVLMAWTMWEQTKFTSEHQKGHGQGRRPWKDLDMILCYDPVSLEALDGYDPRVPKRVLQGGVRVDEWQYTERDWFGTFKFVMLGELHNRKDPFVAIDAFRELREDGELKDAELHLKTSVPGLHPGIEQLIPGVKIYTGLWPRQQVRKFITEGHVLLAPSRGEGKNLPALEMQLSGGVAVATGWGGHAVWQHPSYSPAIEHTLVPVSPGSDSMQAAASKDSLKKLMVDLYEDRVKARDMGRLASRTIRQMCSWEAVTLKCMQYAAEARKLKS